MWSTNYNGQCSYFQDRNRLSFFSPSSLFPESTNSINITTGNIDQSSSKFNSAVSFPTYLKAVYDIFRQTTYFIDTEDQEQCVAYQHFFKSIIEGLDKDNNVNSSTSSPKTSPSKSPLSRVKGRAVKNQKHYKTMDNKSEVFSNAKSNIGNDPNAPLDITQIWINLLDRDNVSGKEKTKMFLQLAKCFLSYEDEINGNSMKGSSSSSKRNAGPKTNEIQSIKRQREDFTIILKLKSTDLLETRYTTDLRQVINRYLKEFSLDYFDIILLPWPYLYSSTGNNKNNNYYAATTTNTLTSGKIMNPDDEEWDDDNEDEDEDEEDSMMNMNDINNDSSMNNEIQFQPIQSIEEGKIFFKAWTTLSSLVYSGQVKKIGIVDFCGWQIDLLSDFTLKATSKKSTLITAEDQNNISASKEENNQEETNPILPPMMYLLPYVSIFQPNEKKIAMARKEKMEVLCHFEILPYSTVKDIEAIQKYSAEYNRSNYEIQIMWALERGLITFVKDLQDVSYDPEDDVYYRRQKRQSQKSYNQEEEDDDDNNNNNNNDDDDDEEVDGDDEEEIEEVEEEDDKDAQGEDDKKNDRRKLKKKHYYQKTPRN